MIKGLLAHMIKGQARTNRIASMLPSTPIGANDSFLSKGMSNSISTRSSSIGTTRKLS